MSKSGVCRTLATSRATVKRGPTGDILFRDAVDAVLWFFALIAAAFLRFDFSIPAEFNRGLLLLSFAVALSNFFLGASLAGRRGFLRAGSFDEWLDLGARTALLIGPLAAITVFFGLEIGVPRSTLLIATPLFLITASLVRAGERLMSRLTAGRREGARRILVYGAGKTGETVASHLRENEQANFVPVGFIDDSVLKISKRVAGIKVFGTSEDLEKVIRKTSAVAVVVAIPRATSDRLANIQSRCKALGLEVFIVPSLSAFLAGDFRQVELRKVSIEDLVGRRAITIDSDRTRDLVRGKVVLITGAGGSIGIELARQVSDRKPARLVFLDRDETGLQSAQLAVHYSGLLNNDDVVLADIRDKTHLEAVFQAIRPEVVFHAAALKHLPVLERFPEEAWKTNVLGTANVLRVSQQVGVRKFVNISTDKAADPTSFLGKSKEIAEQLTSWYSTKSEGHYVSVRFGNVLGSRGSLIPVLSKLIEFGKPIQLTSPDATRYFMTIPEACQLVLQAATDEADSSILILDMGKPVPILQIARKMIEISGRDVTIEFTGLRPGEKLHEELHSLGETLSATSHPLVWRTTSQSLAPTDLHKARQRFFPSSATNPEN